MKKPQRRKIIVETINDIGSYYEFDGSSPDDIIIKMSALKDQYGRREGTTLEIFVESEGVMGLNILRQQTEQEYQVDLDFWKESQKAKKISQNQRDKEIYQKLKKKFEKGK